MTRRQFRILSWSLAVILILTSFFLVWISFEAARETENWNFLDFDFTNREGIISSYGSLLAAILSFVAILFVLLDLFYQRRLNAFETEEKEAAVIEGHRDNLNIIVLFVKELRKDAISQSKTAVTYVKREKNNPTEINRMSFLPNTYPKLILDVDRVRFYDAMQHFRPGDDWRKIYVDLYKITDFYHNSFDELRKKHQIHLDKKFKHSRELAIILDEFIDINSEIRNNIINDCKKDGTDSMDNLYFPLLQEIKGKAIEIISRRTNAEDRISEDYVNPTSLTVWHDEVFQFAFREILVLWNTHGYDLHNLKQLHNKAQLFIREYLRLKQDSQDYSTHIESYFQDFFSKKSKYTKRLKVIIVDIRRSLLY